MIKNIIFDLGGVVIDWNPHYLYDPYFGSAEKAEWFLQNICRYDWNTQHDAGKKFSEGVREKAAEFPEWSKEIQMYFDDWIKMIGGLIPGTSEYALELRKRGYKIYVLSNWSEETFYKVLHFDFFSNIDGLVVSGYEKVTKPDPKIYNILLSRYGLKAEECVFIDDAPHNVDGALAVGIQGIRFESCEQLKTVLEPMLIGNTGF